MKAVFAYITCPDEKWAKKISVMLVKKRLAACTNYFPIRSTYMWQNKLVDSKETIIIAKTTGEKFSFLVKETEKMHPYSIPCITKLTVQPNKKYAEWLFDSIK